MLVVCHVTLSPILLRIMSLTCYFPQCNFVSYFLSCFMKITYLEKILQKIPGETVRAEVGRSFFLLATHFWKENNHNPILCLVTDLSQKSFLLASSAFYTFQNHCSMGHLILLSFFWKQLLIELRVTRFFTSFSFHFYRKAVRAAIVLLPLLGITNSIQMVHSPLEKSSMEFAIWSYGTTFLSTFQGFFCSLIYCFLNGEVGESWIPASFVCLSVRGKQPST